MPDKNSQGATKNFEFLVDNIPYRVRVTPDKFNDEPRFLIEVNGDDGHLYAWDREQVSLRALDDDAVTLPDGLDKAISDMIIKTTLMQ
ncbi:MAG: hypothetical protein EOP49_50875 [Sphingobacteriales bacterium]|nr:MAG: hypothetical protein EOP49_50875 [Sphingobacteriales bacterium]